jgi:hypothetical protein
MVHLLNALELTVTSHLNSCRLYPCFKCKTSQFVNFWTELKIVARIAFRLPSVCLSICLSVYLSVSIYLCLPIYFSVSVRLSIYLCIYLHLSIPIYLSICLSVCLYFSIYLSVYLSICLSVFIFLSISCGPWPLFQFPNPYVVLGLLRWGSAHRKDDIYTRQNRINAHRPHCLEWDSNPLFQCLGGPRYFIPWIARPL